MNSIADLTPAQLRRAADIQERIDSLRHELTALLGGTAPVAPATANRSARKVRMSAAGRAAISAAAKARWAKLRKAKGAAAPAKGSKRKMSASARAAIAAAAKARWAKAKAAGRNRL